MKMKKLLLVVLALAILTSLSAGTLAVYTKTVELQGDTKVKKFTFTAEGGDTNQPIKLAPTESGEFLFDVTNAESTDSEAVHAEVPLKFAVNADISAAAEKMPGLTAKLYKVSGATPATAVATTDDSGKIIYNEPVTSTATDFYKATYKLVLTWDGDDDEAQTTSGLTPADYASNFNVAVTATQKTN